MKIKVGYCSELDHTGSHYTRFTVLTTILPTNCLCIVCTEFLGHLSHSGDLLLWVGVRRRPSCVNIFSSETTRPIFTKFGM